MSVGEAMRRAGFDKNEATFSVAVSRYLNNGGTTERAHALIDAAGQPPTADGRITTARTENGDKSVRAVPQGQTSVAESPAKDNGAVLLMPQGHYAGAPSKAVIAPSAGKVRAMAAAKKQAAKAVLDIGWLGAARIPMGPRAIDLRVCDIPAMVRRQVNDMGNHGKWAVALEMINRELAKRNISETSEEKWVDALPQDVIRNISAMTEKEVLIPMAAGWARGFINAAHKQIELTGQVGGADKAKLIEPVDA